MKTKARDKFKRGIQGVMGKLGMVKEEPTKYPNPIEQMYVCYQASYKPYESKGTIDVMYAHSYTTAKQLRKMEYKRTGGRSGGSYLRFTFHKKDERKKGIYLYVDADGFYDNEGYITKFEQGGKPLGEQLRSYELSKWFKDQVYEGEEAGRFFKNVETDLGKAHQLLNQYAESQEKREQRIERLYTPVQDFAERSQRIVELYENHYKTLMSCKGRKVKLKVENGLLYIKVGKRTVKTDMKDLYDMDTGEPIDNVSGSFLRQVEGFKFGRYLKAQIESTDSKLLRNCLAQGYDLRRTMKDTHTDKVMGENYGGLKVRPRNL